jgi:hypothetical protein
MEAILFSNCRNLIVANHFPTQASPKIRLS